MGQLEIAQEIRLYALYASKVQNYDLLQSVWESCSLEKNWTTQEIFRLWDGVAVENHQRKLQMYMHIPFCEEFCDFCVYYKRLLKGKKLEEACEEYVEFVVAQLEYLAPAFRGAQFHALSIGGGTPSVLSVNQMQRLFGAIFRFFDFDTSAYRGIEFRPSSTDTEKLQNIRNLGFNTVHFGVQSLDEDVLKNVNRKSDTSEKVQASVFLARSAGFPIVQTHMIMGLVGDTPEKFLHTIHALCAMNVDVVAVYTLLTTNFYIQKHFANNLSTFHTWLRDFAARCFEKISQSPPKGYRLRLDGGATDHTVHSFSLERVDIDVTKKQNNIQSGYGDVDLEGVNLFGIGPSARSYRYGRASYRGIKNCPNTQFNPHLSLFEGSERNQEDEMRRLVLIGWRDEGCVSEIQFRSLFGKGLKDAFPRAVVALIALGVLVFDHDVWRFLERDLRKRFIYSLFFSGPQYVVHKLPPQEIQSIFWK